MAAEELLGAPEVLHLEQAVTATEGRGADGAPDAVIHGVAEHGRGPERHARERRLQDAAGIHRRQRAHRKQQRVPRQEGRHHQPGLREDHREQDRIDPQLIAGQQLEEVPIKMQDHVDEPREHVAGEDIGKHPLRVSTARRRRLEANPQGTSARMATGSAACCARAPRVFRVSSATRTSLSRSARGAEPLPASSSAGGAPGPSSTTSGTMPLP